MPLRSRHGYAVVLHRGLPGPAGETGLEVHRATAAMAGRRGIGDAPLTSPHPPGWSWHAIERRNDTGSSRTPSSLAHRARPIR
jgi:hypothetical protein